jgi:hypothetical protein
MSSRFGRQFPLAIHNTAAYASFQLKCFILNDACNNCIIHEYMTPNVSHIFALHIIVTSFQQIAILDGKYFELRSANSHKNTCNHFMYFYSNALFYFY